MDAMHQVPIKIQISNINSIFKINLQHHLVLENDPRQYHMVIQELEEKTIDHYMYNVK